MTKYTGTFLGGPYDGEIETYDLAGETPIIFRDDPMADENQFVILTDTPYIDSSEPRMYEWRMDDDGRGWWVRSAQ